METLEQKAVKNESEITLRELILKVGEWWFFLLAKWRLILITGLLGGAVGFVYGLIEKPKYVGELTFVMEDSKAGGGLLSAYSGLASQFGIDLGGSGSGVGVFSGEDNIMAFLKSRLMVERTLLTPIQVDGKSQTLVELYIRMYNMHKKLDRDPALITLHYPVGQPREKFSLKQDSVLNLVQAAIVKSNLEIKKAEGKADFISVKTTTNNELFSKVFTERLVKEATEFYIATKVKRSKSNVDKLQKIADSLELLLNQKTYAVAASQDLNINPARKVAAVASEVQARDKMVLQTMYGEVVKNLELSKMAMVQETPVFQIIDTPILPLEKKKTRKLMAVIGGCVLFTFLYILFLICRKLYQKIMLGEVI